MSGPSAEEELLLKRLRGGDQEALAALFALHRDRLRRMVSWRLDPRLNGRLDPSDVLRRSSSTPPGGCRRTWKSRTCPRACGCAC